ncbi:MAG: hypothetical protein AB7O80_16635 [Acetobacteraceae bacterium]
MSPCDNSVVSLPKDSLPAGVVACSRCSVRVTVRPVTAARACVARIRDEMAIETSN